MKIFFYIEIYKSYFYLDWYVDYFVCIFFIQNLKKCFVLWLICWLFNFQSLRVLCAVLWWLFGYIIMRLSFQTKQIAASRKTDKCYYMDNFALNEMVMIWQYGKSNFVVYGIIHTRQDICVFCKLPHSYMYRFLLIVDVTMNKNAHHS